VGFEVYLNCFGETLAIGISRVAVRSLFPVIEGESEPDFWRVRYDDQNCCHVGVTALPSEKARLKGLSVDRPCADVRLWEALLCVLRMGSVVMFWPGSPPVVADDAIGMNLSEYITDTIGRPRSVRSGEEILRLLRET
jgi:hypothetical protein